LIKKCSTDKALTDNFNKLLAEIKKYSFVMARVEPPKEEIKKDEKPKKPWREKY
jgi:hypothetical protein